MNRIIIKITLVIAMLSAVVASYGYDFEYNGLKYNFTTTETGEKAVVVASNQIVSGDLIIPETVPYENEVYTVVAIGSYAFDEYNHESLTSVVIPNTVTSIGQQAFGTCYNLESVTLPNALVSIGKMAFQDCESLKSPIVIPNTVTSIGYYAFNGCRALESITIPSTLNLTSIPEALFLGCSNLKSIVIPTTVTNIGAMAFADCYCLTSIDIPDNVTTIGHSAFAHCYGLKTIHIPSNVTTIGKYVFDGGFPVDNEPIVFLESIYCHAEIPPTAVELGHSYTPYANELYLNATLYVPQSSLDAYQSTAPWNKFTNIIGMEDSGIDEVLADNGLQVAVEGQSIIIPDDAGTFDVFNANGQLIYHGNNRRVDGLQKGVYIVRTADKVTKVII